MPDGSKTLTPEELQEQEDKKSLAEANSKIEEIINLITENHDRETTHEKVERAREGLKTDIEGKSTNRLDGNVFHPYNGKRVAMKLRNSRLLDLADALELKLKAHGHGEDLHKSLTWHIIKKIKVLERQIERLVKS